MSVFSSKEIVRSSRMSGAPRLSTAALLCRNATLTVVVHTKHVIIK